MIYDYVVDAETGSKYKTKHFEGFEEALAYYEDLMLNEGWEYMSLRKRTMDSVTLGDVYEDLFTYEAE